MISFRELSESTNLIKHLKDPLLKNSYFNMINTLIGSISGIFFWMLVTRLYNPVDIGLASAITSLSNLILALSYLGLGFGIRRFLPCETDKQGMINSCITLRFLVSLFISILFILGIDLWSPAISIVKNNYSLALLFIMLVCSNSIIAILTNVFMALRSTEFTVIQILLACLSKIIFIIGFVKFGVSGILASVAIATIVSIIPCIIIFLPKKVNHYRLIPIINFSHIKKLSTISLFNYIAETLAALPNSILPLIIISILDPESNAYFFIALSIINVLYSVPLSLANSLLVEGSYEPDKLNNNVIKAIVFLFIITLPMLFVIIISGKEMLLLFGKSYSMNSYILLCILASSIIPYGINTIYFTRKNIQLKIIPIIYIKAIISILTVLFCYILILKFRLNGAALGYTLGQAFGTFIIFVIILYERAKNN